MTRWPATLVCLKGLLTLVALFAGLAGWAALVPLSAAVIVPGRVEVDLNRQIIQHPDGGVVARLAVQEGTRVARGDVLLILQGATLRARAAQLQARLDALRARQLRLRAERDGAPTSPFPRRCKGRSRPVPPWPVVLHRSGGCFGPGQGQCAMNRRNFPRKSARLPIRSLG